MFDDEQKHAYWLIHDAKNAKAAVKMKEEAHSAINKSSLPEDLLAMDSVRPRGQSG